MLPVRPSRCVAGVLGLHVPRVGDLHGCRVWWCVPGTVGDLAVGSGVHRPRLRVFLRLQVQQVRHAPGCCVFVVCLFCCCTVAAHMRGTGYGSRACSAAPPVPKCFAGATMSRVQLRVEPASHGRLSVSSYTSILPTCLHPTLPFHTWARVACLHCVFVCLFYCITANQLRLQRYTTP